MDICDRINEIIKHENLNIASFARKIGIGDQTVRGVVAMRRNKPGFDFIMKIVQTFDWLNAHWLITGEGDMICENLLTRKGRAHRAAHPRKRRPHRPLRPPFGGRARRHPRVTCNPGTRPASAQGAFPPLSNPRVSAGAAIAA